jgi:hypothetical protein
VMRPVQDSLGVLSLTRCAPRQVRHGPRFSQRFHLAPVDVRADGSGRSRAAG